MFFNQRTKISLCLLITSLLLVLFFIPPVMAQNDEEPSGLLQEVSSPLGDAATRAGFQTGGEAVLETTTGRIIGVFLGFLGVIALVLVLYAGFLWMTAGGNEEKVTKARKLMTSAVIGLIIILISGFITVFIMSKLQAPGRASLNAPLALIQPALAQDDGEEEPTPSSLERVLGESGLVGGDIERGKYEGELGFIIGQIISIFLGFLGVVALVLVLYGGFMWMT
ncbi:MAG TPA: hypothetical protein VGA49_01060, partial [Patescibacteria group bacterium]